MNSVNQLTKRVRAKKLRNIAAYLVLIIPLLNCSPTVYTPPETLGIQNQSRTVEYNQSINVIWSQLTDYIRQSSYGIDSMDTDSYYAEISFVTKDFHKYLDGGILKEGGFNGYEGDLLEFILPTSDYKSSLSCTIRIQLSQNSLKTTILSFKVYYETKYAKKKREVLSEFTFDSEDPMVIPSDDPAINYTLAPSYLLEKQLFKTFSNFK